MKAILARHVARVRKHLRVFFALHSTFYWIIVTIILVGSPFVTPKIEDALGMISWRYGLFQWMSEFEWRPLIPRFVKVVLVHDNEHYGSILQGMVPIKRNYVGTLVDKLAKDNASVIALDFDMRLDDPQLKGTIGDFAEISSDTRTDVKVLVTAIEKAANEGHKIVLSRTVGAGANGYTFQADIYQPYGLCSGLNWDGSWQNPGLPGQQAGDPTPNVDPKKNTGLSPTAAANIACGYILLPYDMRLLPPRILADGKAVDSFSFALAKAINPAVAGDVAGGAYYSSYIPEETIKRYGVTLDAADIRLGKTIASEAVNGHAVIVGGAWHDKASGVGNVVDIWATPIGPIIGAVIHENFTEAILDSRTFRYVPEWILVALELIFSLGCAILFAIYESVPAKLLTLVGLGATLVIVQWVMLQIFGTFFEALVPLLGLGFHSILERLIGQR